MNGHVFAGLTKLKLVLLQGNICISENFFDKEKIATLAQVVDAKCGLNHDCGKVAFGGGLIFNGLKTSRGLWPFLVALHHILANQVFCGASLISTKHVHTGDSRI